MWFLWNFHFQAIGSDNHPAQGDYNTEALIFKMATTRFLMPLKKTKKKMHLL